MVFLFQSFITSLCTALCATLGLISICPHITCGEYIQIHYAAGALTTLVPLVHCGATKFQTRFLITAFDWHFSSPRDALLPASQVAVCFCLLVCFFYFIYLYRDSSCDSSQDRDILSAVITNFSPISKASKVF